MFLCLITKQVPIYSLLITPVKIRNLSVTGEKGYAKLNLITQNIALYESIIEAEIDDYGDYIVKFQEPKFSVIKSNGKEPLALEIDNFIEAANEKEKLRVDPKMLAPHFQLHLK